MRETQEVGSEMRRPDPGTLVRSPVAALLAAAVLFVVITFLRWHLEGMVGSVSIGYVLPIALLAVRYGPWAGLGSALLSLGLFGIWDVASPAVVTPLQYGSLAVVFLLTGLGLGGYAAQLRRQDATRRQMFAELAESQERYRALMEHAPEAIVVLDLERSVFVDANENACRLFELPRAELLRSGPVDLSPPTQPSGEPSAQAAAAYIQQAVDGGTPMFEWEHRTASGRTVPCEIRLARLPHPERVLVRGSIADISERRRTEQKLAEAEVASKVAARVSDLTRITEAALAHLELKQLLPELAFRVRQILDVDNAGILLMDRTGHLMLETATGIEESSPRLALGEGFAGRVAALRRPVMVRGSDVEQLAVNPVLHRLRSLLGVPLLSGDRLLGVLHVGSFQEREWTDDEVNLLQLAAERAALGIEHSHVYEWQRALASVLQRSLLPRRLPRIPGIELQARYRPAGFQVGGDFYDVVELPDQRWLLFVGDVCGKGPEAAALTALARYTLRAEATHETRPAELLRLLNRTLLKENDEGAALLTAVCSVLTPGTGEATLEMAAAGHPPPLILRANGEVQSGSGAGEILGVFSRVNPALSTVELRHGDAVIFYTDGLLDAQAPKSILETSDLAAALTRSTATTLAERMAELERLAVGDATQPRDDIAILAVRQKNEAQITDENGGTATVADT